MRRKSLIIAALAVALILLASCQSVSDSTIVTVGNDRIPALYTAVGEREIIGRESTDSRAALTYQGVSQSDLNAYVSALQKDGFSVTSNNGDKLQLAKESVTEGQVVLVSLEVPRNNSATIIYAVASGSLRKNG